MTCMIVDCHTHLMWYPDHVSQTYAEEALASKLIKLKVGRKLADAVAAVRAVAQAVGPDVPLAAGCQHGWRIWA